MSAANAVSRARTRTSRRWTSPFRRYIGAVTPLVLLGLWEVGARLGVVDARFFPPPTTIGSAFVEMVMSGELWEHIIVSLIRIFVGFLLGAVPGIALGLIMGFVPLVRAAFQPLVDALLPIPKIAILPLLLMVFGLGETTKYLVIAIGVFFPVLINTMAGVVNIDRIYIDVGRNFGAGRLYFYRTVALPGSLPMIFAGLKLGVGVAFLLIVAAEFVGARSGIGFMIWNGWQVFRVEQLYVGLFLISVFGILFAAAVDRLESALLPWK